MDSIDVAQSNAETAQEAAIKTVINSAKINKLAPKGTCYYCDEKLEKGLFCDIDCSNDFEWEQNCNNRRG